MAIERSLSRFAAMRNPYCLLVEPASPRDLPELLRPYYRDPWGVELRVLYKEGEEIRRQWLFREGEANRLSAVFTRDGASGGEVSRGEDAGTDDSADAAEAPVSPLGFIELYGDHGFMVMERQFLEDGEELIIDYIYRTAEAQRSGGNPGGEVLIRSNTRRRYLDGEGLEVLEDLYTDYYRYTRNQSLRQIERVFNRRPPITEDSGERAEEGEGTGEGAGLSNALMRFPRRSLDSETETNFVSPGPSSGSSFPEEAQTEAPHRIVYNTDERGRILEETREDEEGNVIGEMKNEWAGNRISRVTWMAGEDEWATEYTYDRDGDRIEERNYKNGVLERVVRIQGDREDEELYMNGELILRARWEGGRKVHEEQVRPENRNPSGRGSSSGRNP
jgi:hypothetical protein